MGRRRETDLRGRAAVFLVGATAISFGALLVVVQRESEASTAPVETYLSLSFPDKKDGFVAASKGSTSFLLKTNSTGKKWARDRLGFGIDSPGVSPVGGAGAMQALQFLNSSTGWMMGYSLTKCQPQAPPNQATCDDGLYATHDGGRVWRRQIGLGQLAELGGFQFVNARTGWIISSRCRTPASSHAGRDTGAGIVCGYDQRILMTSDGGRRWSPASWSIVNVDMFRFASPKFGWAVTGTAPASGACFSAVYLTSTGGRLWKRSLNLPHQCQTLASFSDSTNGWVVSGEPAKCGSGGCPTETLRRTRNGGRTWTLTQGAKPGGWAGTLGFLQEVRFLDTKHGWLTFELGASLNTAGGIATTSDGGKKWRRSFPCYQVEPGGAQTVGTSDLWLTGSWVSYCSQPKGSGLFHSSDWGKTWREVWPKA